MEEDREQRLGKFFEDALNQTLNEYLREIKDDFIKRYDLNSLTEHELDFVVGMVVNEIFNRFSSNIIKNNMKITNEEKGFFYRSISHEQINLRSSVRRLLEV
jgi:hypothetical protein